jgi:TolB-like protein
MDGERMRVTVELCDRQGFVTWSAQIDHHAAENLVLQETLSGDIISRMPSWLLGTPTRDRPLVAVVS